MVKSVVIIDFGAGNIRSIYNAFNNFPHLNIKVVDSYRSFKDSDYIILPGVGAFDSAMNKLSKKEGVVDALLEQLVVKKKNFLGICVGMQLLADIGYENKKTQGLGVVRGEVNSFPKGPGCLPVPHMGWNNINIIKGNFKKFDMKDFYFVHSYFFALKDQASIIATTNYGIDFPCIIEKENILATQFHPEKSGKQGVEFLKFFIDK